MLRNLAGIREQSALDAIEAAETAARLVELRFRPVRGNFDATHLRSIHCHLFHSLYPWAGQWRTVSLAKGGSLFCEPAFIDGAIADLLRKLQTDERLRTPAPDVFAGTGAFYLGELNAIHPFREGNGRTQREFVRELAVRTGFDLRWSGVSGADMQHASAAAQGGDYSALEVLLRSGLRRSRRP